MDWRCSSLAVHNVFYVKMTLESPNGRIMIVMSPLLKIFIALHLYIFLNIFKINHNFDISKIFFNLRNSYI